jgi:O-antigen ligase
VAVGVLIVLGRKLVLILPIAIAVVAALVPSTPLHTKVRTMFDPTSPSVTERVYFWEAGVRMVHDAPWLGLGPGGVKRAYPDYKNPAARRPGTSHLHNNVVQIAAERGLLGLAAWLWVWAAFFWTAGRIYVRLGRRDDDASLVAGSLAGVAGFLVAGFFEYNFGDSEVIGLVWLVMAFPFVVGAVRKEEARRQPLWPEGRVP